MRFSEFLKAALEEGPRVITGCGIEQAVLVPVDEWRRRNESARPNIKESLLSGPRCDLPIAKRRRWKLCPPIDFTQADDS